MWLGNYKCLQQTANQYSIQCYVSLTNGAKLLQAFVINDFYDGNHNIFTSKAGSPETTVENYIIDVVITAQKCVVIHASERTPGACSHTVEG